MEVKIKIKVTATETPDGGEGGTKGAHSTMA